MAISQDNVRVQVVIDKITYEELKEDAKQKGLSVSALIRMMILERKK